MNRKNAIEALLAKAETQFSEIRDEYDSSLHNKSISDSLKVDIKNFFENLRSTLDYIAHSFREEYCADASKKTRFYFPILPDEPSFNQRMEQWYPDLEEKSPELYKFLQSVQPYNSSQSWLGNFNKVNNENKHGSLVEQTRNETMRIAAKTQNTSVSWNPDNVKFGSGVKIGGVPVNPATQMPVPSPTQTVTKTVWIDFRFQGVNESALQLMEEALAGVGKIFTEIDSIMKS